MLPGDDVVLHGEDGAAVVVDPGDLVAAEAHHGAAEHHVATLGHRHVPHAADEVRAEAPGVSLVSCGYQHCYELFPSCLQITAAKLLEKVIIVYVSS